MNKLVIPLYIPTKSNKVDYESLKNIVDDIENSSILIGDYGLNNLSDNDYIEVYLYLNVVDHKNEYYTEKNYNDPLIKYFKNENNNYVITKLGNVLSNEINEYLLNQELKVVDKILNNYLKIFRNIINKNEKKYIKYILVKKKKIIKDTYKDIDNLLGINEI